MHFLLFKISQCDLLRVKNNNDFADFCSASFLIMGDNNVPYINRIGKNNHSVSPLRDLSCLYHGAVCFVVYGEQS